MYIEYLVHSWLGLSGGGRGKPVWKKTGVAQLTCRPHPLIHKTGPDFKGQRRARGKKNMRVYKRHGGRFFRASFSLITQRYQPRAWLISLYAACHALRLFANILQVAPKIFVGFFLCFWQKAESARYQIGKNSVKHQQFKDLVICFGEFLKNLLARLLSQLFLPQTLWFFLTGVLVVWIFLFFFCTTTTWNPSFFI